MKNMRSKLKEKYLCYIIASTSLLQTSCKKFLDVGAPTTSINAENVYQSDYTAASVLTGLYTQMMGLEFSSGGVTSLSLLPELSADNLILYNRTALNNLYYWQNALNPTYDRTRNYFATIYPKIYVTNAAIEGINSSVSLTPSIKRRLLGEAFFLRSFYYFYLTNLYGDIPLALTTDYTQNASLPRSTVTDVYEQINKDLNRAAELLDDEYLDAAITKQTQERVRPNLSAALSLLSRVKLYQKKYTEAENISTQVINKTQLYSLVDLDNVFKKNSNETIWALQPVKTGYNTDEAAIFLLKGPPGPTTKSLSLSTSLISTFEPNDKRLSKWIGIITSGSNQYYYAAKYKADANSGSVTEYCIVLRLAELYLIRAEARLQQNNITGALDDLNTIRIRAGLPPINRTNAEDIKNDILKERRVELFTEWGHRWLDLKRSGKIDSIMIKEEETKGGSWSPHKSLYPIPNSEILNNAKLTQNTGY